MPEKVEKQDDAPYYEQIQQDISARREWNNLDNEILKRRLGEREADNVPYINAPNPIVNIIDDTVTQRTDVEISMIMNTPLLAHFIPIGQTDRKLAYQAERGFDTLLRHFMEFRLKKDEAVDTKNARGFAICRVARTEDELLDQVIPTFEVVDPKDIIVPANTKNIRTAERIVRVIRFTERKFVAQKKKGWQNIDTILEYLGKNDDTEDGVETADETNEDSTTKTTEVLIGINTSEINTGKIVVWETFHYATEWDVKQDTTGRIKLGEKCITYICPDYPQFLLFGRDWKDPEQRERLTPEEQVTENESALAQGREPITTKVVSRERPRDWPFIQHRAENRAKGWYDTRGLGHTCMDNHLTASGLKKRKMIFTDYHSNPMFKRKTAYGSTVNPMTKKIAPGQILDDDIDPITPPPPPTNLDFDIDQEKREASNRSIAGQSMFSGQISENRKLQKTATEVQAESAKSAMLSSASVDRFNDADRELFKQLWDECKRLKVKLPIITNNKFLGFASEEIYAGTYKIVPASSQKNLNPDMEFLKWKEVYTFVLDVALKLGIPANSAPELKRGASIYDPHFAENMLPETEGEEGNPFSIMMQKVMQLIEQHSQGIEENTEAIKQVGELAVDNKEELEKIDDQAERIIESTIESQQQVA